MENPLSSIFFLNSFSSLLVVEHGQLAVRVAGIIAGAELNGADVESLQLFEHLVERELRKQRL